ncbi:MAG TPA: DUF1190 domain-containing protein [Pseudomonas sp.]|uniref:DUF1190 domain-containing protein n=1 Tax=Pseudomonas sp. TaxID=306 RepID=UPI002EDB0D4D
MIGMTGTLASAHLSEQPPRWMSSVAFYENANACLWAGVAPHICRAGYRSAFRQHIRTAPSYRDVADCDRDFYANECATSGGEHQLWTPWLSGFALIVQSRLPSSAEDQHHIASSSDDPWKRLFEHDEGMETPDAQTRYFSEPLYWEKDGQGGSRLTTLREMLRNGQRFEKALSRHSPDRIGAAPDLRQLARSFDAQQLFDVTRP